MSKTVDLKIAKIYEHLKEKPSFENKEFKSLNSELVYEILSKNSNETVNIWFRLQQAWCNNAYNTFKDYDSYLVLVYLILNIFQNFEILLYLLRLNLYQYLLFHQG